MDTPAAQVVPDKIEAAAIAALLAPRLRGTPLSATPATAEPASGLAAAPTSVVWVDGEDEVLVHLDSLATRIAGTTLLVSIDLETDQTGRTPLVVRFAINNSDAANFVVATDEFPRGNGILAARWGGAVRNAAWSALLAIATDHATERDAAPRGFRITNDRLALSAGPPPSLA